MFHVPWSFSDYILTIYNYEQCGSLSYRHLRRLDIRLSNAKMPQKSSNNPHSH